MSLKDIDNIIQHFIQKCIQVIVQSRQGTEKIRTKCTPKVPSWFNLDIGECEDILHKTVKCLKSIKKQSTPSNLNLFFVKRNWKICCEISLRNADGISLVLEYWLFTNTSSNAVETVIDRKHVYQMINRMSSMLKSLIVLTRSTPAYKLSSKGQSADSYVICYRVNQCDDDFASDIIDLGNQSGQFSLPKTIGTIKGLLNELSIQLVYRTSMNMNSDSEIRTATKYDVLNDKANQLLPVKDDHFKSDITESKFDIKDIFKPLNPAFATKHKDVLDTFSTSPFMALLSQNSDSSDSISSLKESTLSKLKSEKSNPISIPSQILPKSISKSPQIYSTSNESFVFVDLNAPFASDDREFGPFFNGPSPTFINNSDDSCDDVNELCLQLEELESNAQQLDSFIESIYENENENENEEIKIEN